MPDGAKRRRRSSDIAAQRGWYAFYRSVRFNRRLGFLTVEGDLCRAYMLYLS